MTDTPKRTDTDSNNPCEGMPFQAMMERMTRKDGSSCPCMAMISGNGSCSWWAAGLFMALAWLVLVGLPLVILYAVVAFTDLA